MNRQSTAEPVTSITCYCPMCGAKTRFQDRCEHCGEQFPWVEHLCVICGDKLPRLSDLTAATRDCDRCQGQGRIPQIGRSVNRSPGCDCVAPFPLCPGCRASCLPRLPLWQDPAAWSVIIGMTWLTGLSVGCVLLLIVPSTWLAWLLFAGFGLGGLLLHAQPYLRRSNLERNWLLKQQDQPGLQELVAVLRTEQRRLVTQPGSSLSYFLEPLDEVFQLHQPAPQEAVTHG